MIPDFNTDGLLPKGIHWSTMTEIKSTFGFSEKRKALINGLLEALKSFKNAGCKTIYIDGSFVTSKLEPGDIDACWDIKGVDPTKLDPVLLIFSNQRRQQKLKYGCEFFPSNEIAEPPNVIFLDFFQKNRNNLPKGIIGIRL